jgi:acetyl-CoA carboxylase biotin carboxyl carrier protein
MKKNHGPIDAEAIRELAHLLTETGLTEIEIEQGGQRVRVARMGAPAAAHAVAAPVAASASPAADTAKKDGHAVGAVTSPMVGTVYISPEPGKPPFVKVGDRVKEGDTLLIVEAMKTMNPILAPRGGTIGEICIHDSQPVEFGQPLVILN